MLSEDWPFTFASLPCSFWGGNPAADLNLAVRTRGPVGCGAAEAANLWIFQPLRRDATRAELSAGTSHLKKVMLLWLLTNAKVFFFFFFFFQNSKWNMKHRCFGIWDGGWVASGPHAKTCTEFPSWNSFSSSQITSSDTLMDGVCSAGPAASERARAAIKRELCRPEPDESLWVWLGGTFFIIAAAPRGTRAARFGPWCWCNCSDSSHQSKKSEKIRFHLNLYSDMEILTQFKIQKKTNKSCCTLCIHINGKRLKLFCLPDICLEMWQSNNRMTQSFTVMWADFHPPWTLRFNLVVVMSFVPTLAFTRLLRHERARQHEPDVEEEAKKRDTVHGYIYSSMQDCTL